MENLYSKYGYYKETLFTQTFAGADGADKIGAIAEKFRSGAFDRIGDEKVIAKRDYEESVRVSADGEVSALGLPKSNVIYFEFADGWCAVRPSGTEPKIKFYIGVKGKSTADAENRVKKIKDYVTGIIG